VFFRLAGESRAQPRPGAGAQQEQWEEAWLLLRGAREEVLDLVAVECLDLLLPGGPPVHEICCENLGGDFETPAIEHFFEDHSDLRFVIFAKRFSCAARIDAGDDCIAARIGIAIARLSPPGP